MIKIGIVGDIGAGKVILLDNLVTQFLMLINKFLKYKENNNCFKS